MRTALAVVATAGIALVALAASAASALDEPAGFKEAKFWDSEQAVRAKMGIPPASRAFDPYCSSFPKRVAWLGDRSCWYPNSIGDVPVKATYIFRNDHLVRIRFAFDPLQYAQIRTAFTSRFGPPMTQDRPIVKTGAGVEYVNEELTWTGRTLWISLSKYLTKISESGASYVMLSELATSEALRQAQGAKGAEDLR